MLSFHLVRIFLILYGLLFTVNGCADKFILYPSTQPINARGATHHAITHNSKTIEFWTARSSNDKSGPEAFVLEFTGNGTRAEQIATYAAARWKNHNVELWA